MSFIKPQMIFIISPTKYGLDDLARKGEKK